MNSIKIIRSGRSTLSIEICSDGTVLVRAPLLMSERRIGDFIEKKQPWIQKKLKFVNSMPAPVQITDEEVALLRRRAKKVLPQKLAFWSEKTGLDYSGVKVTSARTRFGSCNGKNRICFSLYLASYPEELIDYVVVHELCHTKEHNHSKAFYALLSSILPDWKEREAHLRSIPMPRIKSSE